jgi:hypothetical protein
MSPCQHPSTSAEWPKFILSVAAGSVEGLGTSDPEEAPFEVWRD